MPCLPLCANVLTSTLAEAGWTIHRSIAMIWITMGWTRAGGLDIAAQPVLVCSILAPQPKEF